MSDPRAPSAPWAASEQFPPRCRRPLRSSATEEVSFLRAQVGATLDAKQNLGETRSVFGGPGATVAHVRWSATD
jgi:hypothetical protein